MTEERCSLRDASTVTLPYVMFITDVTLEPRGEWKQLALDENLGLVNMNADNLFVCGTKFTNFFAQRRRACDWSSVFFSIFKMSSHSGDIRDQSRKLSEIAPNFGRFFALPNLRGSVFQNLYAHYHSYLLARYFEKFREDTPTCPEVIGAHTLNFKPNFKCSRLKLYWVTPVRVGDER